MLHGDRAADRLAPPCTRARRAGRGPRPVQDWVPNQSGTGWFWCSAQTTDEAREFAEALDGARLEQDEKVNAYQLDYRFEYSGNLLDVEVHLWFAPLLTQEVE